MELVIKNKHCELKPFDFRAIAVAWKFIVELEEALGAELAFEYIATELEGTEARFGQCNVKVPKFNITSENVLHFCFQTTSKERPVPWEKGSTTRRKIFRKELRHLARAIRWEMRDSIDLHKKLGKIVDAKK